MTNPFNPSEIARLAPFVPGSTARESTVHIDEAACKAQASKQWLLEGRDEQGSHPITPHNVITMLIGGQEGFAAIAADLENARATVDLVCWGFDPAMELVRTAGTWPRGETYGELLRRIATRAEHPVRVRLLVWYSFIASQMMRNLPGDTDPIALVKSYPATAPLTDWPSQGSRKRDDPSGLSIRERRALHCREWWTWARDIRNREQIEIVRRSADSDAIAQLIYKEKYQPDTGPYNERHLMVGYGTHHQKTVLIDYHHDNGAHAVGYVMGLNSLTGYWDTRQHRFNDPLRERQLDAPAGTSVTAVLENVQKAHGDTADVRVDPLHDYACRIRGQALQCTYRNFQAGWLRHNGSRQNNDTLVPTRLAEAARYGQGSRLQVVRTQPEEADQTIRDIYFHATGQASNYLYLENQYFQYTEWAEHLVSTRKAHRTLYQKVAGERGPQAPNLLHVFVVIPKPERAEMVPRTFDTLKVLGRSDLMHELDADQLPQGQWVAMMQERDVLREWEIHHPLNAEKRRQLERQYRETLDIHEKQVMEKYAGPHLSQVAFDAERITEPTLDELEAQGIKILVAMLESYDDGGSGLKGKGHADKYRQIYIHSKLLIIDDAFFTIGSANLNQRSMAADSEINVATDDPVQSEKLRRDVWGQHTGGFHDGGNGNKPDIKEAYKKWGELMKKNDQAKTDGIPLKGFLCTFHDSKTSRTRYA